MKTKTEIIYKGQVHEDIDRFDGLLNVRVGDKFYLSLRGPCPRSENEYLEKYSNYPEKILKGVIEDINKKCHEYHILHCKVIRISRSYEKDYGFSISEPNVQYTETITVREVFKLKYVYWRVRRYFRELLQK